MAVRTFAVFDYIVFAFCLSVAAIIGVYYACSGGKQRTTKEFLQANKNMPIMPVVFSMVATFLSTIGILGAPAEMYNFGTLLSWSYFGPIIACPLCAHLFLPIFYDLEMISIYEYFQHRFGTVVRVISVIVYIIWMELYMAVVFFAPALALQQVTGLSIEASILSSGFICTFYTGIGGMKAVLWTDTFQIFVIIASIATVMMKGTLQVGGIEEVWRISEEGGRQIWFEFPGDPTQRMTTLCAISGGVFTVLSLNAASQAMLQRNMTVKTLNKAKVTLYLYGFGYVIAFNTLCVLGLIIYANYHDCDPMLKGYISKPDQLLPLFVMDTVGHLRGLPGLFLSALFSAAISTVSSGVNSLAAVLLEDIVKPIYWKKKKKEIHDHMATNISKGVAVFLGFLTIALAFLASAFSATVIQLVFTIYGIAGGPLFAMFALGMTVPFINQKGCAAGAIVSLVFGMWMGFGRVFLKAPKITLDRTIAGCPDNATLFTQSLNETLISTFNETTTAVLTTAAGSGTEISWGSYTAKTIDQLYRVSHMWYGLIALGVVSVVAITVSLFTGGLDHEVDERLLFSYAVPIQRWIRRVRGPPNKYYKYQTRQEKDKEKEDKKKKALAANLRRGSEIAEKVLPPNAKIYYNWTGDDKPYNHAQTDSNNLTTGVPTTIFAASTTKF